MTPSIGKDSRGRFVVYYGRGRKEHGFRLFGKYKTITAAERRVSQIEHSSRGRENLPECERG